MPLHLVIANKNYSSWSLRPWLAMKVAAIPFAETVVSLDRPDFKTDVRRLAGVAPAGKLPVLLDGSIRVWESLAILEYLAEKFPGAGLWPVDAGARARARAVAAEMHAGFARLRRQLPMNVCRRVKPLPLDQATIEDIARIETIWRDCRDSYGRGGGPFLFGAFGAADAMYAPVVWRFRTYAVAVSDTSRAYMDAVLDLPAMAEWRDAARREPWVLPHDEVDWPDVPREE